MSISKAQAALLADGVLDSMGTSKGALELRETFTELIVLATDLAEDAQDNLNQADKIASGGLSESIEVMEPVHVGNIVSCDIEMNFYGKFVNAGVKGTRSGSSTEGYSFKNEFPSKGMVSAIKEWLKRAGKKTSSSDVKKYGAYGKHERKQKRISEFDGAYAVAHSIKVKGLKPTGFMDKAIKRTADKMADQLGAAFEVDIINSLELGDNLKLT